MAYLYKMSESCCYVPLHLNSVFSEKFKFNTNYIEPEMLSEICENINISNFKYIVFDLKNIANVYSRVYSIFKELILSGKNLIFINACDDVFFGIKNVDLKGLLQADSSENIIASSDCMVFFKEEICNKSDVNLTVDIFKKKYIANYLKKFSIKNNYYLDSSNVYSNAYINIKSIFLNNEVLSLSIYELCKIINNDFDSKEYNKLLCVSHNGSAIANILGILLDIDVTYLLNLGPHLSISEKNMIQNISLSDRYIFIYDFICLGSEYKLAKTAVGLHGAKIVGSVGVSHHIAPSRKEEMTKSIFKVSGDYGFDYKVNIYQGE